MSFAMEPDKLDLMRVLVVTAAGGRPGRSHEEVARAAVAGGCRAVQLRDKELSDGDFTEVAKNVAAICRKAQALFFVNDRVDVARTVGAHGVHLGVQDLAVAAAREAMPPGSLIGFSPESQAEASRAVAEGADYLGVGPVFATSTKEDAGSPIGLEGLAAYCESAEAPVIAVGGVNAGNAASAIASGASGVAVVSAVASAHDMKSAAREIVEAVEGAAWVG